MGHIIPKHNLCKFMVLAWRCSSMSIIATCELKYLKIHQQKSSSLHKNFSTSESEMHLGNGNKSTIFDLHKTWRSHFETNGVPDPDLSIRYIIEHVLGMDKAYEYELKANTIVTEEQVTKIASLCECRLARMPVQYIIKEWDFRELRLAMCPPVFIPRPETEQFVGIILDSMPADACFLEVGCGSGAISLSLLKALPQSRAIAIDQSKMACQLTLNNYKLNGLTSNLQVVHSKLKDDGSLSEPLPSGKEQINILVSNPPYVPYAQMMALEPEIKLYEDLRALEGGRDGLRVIKAIFLLAQTVLRPGGLVFLEVDSSHPKLIEQWLEAHPQLYLNFVKTVKDYCDKDRFVVLKKV